MDFTVKNTTFRVNVPTRTALETALRQRFSEGVGFSLVTINLDHLAKLNSDPQFLRAYGQQDLVVADGNPIVWLSKLNGNPVELLPGSDLVAPLARLAADAGVNVALVGSTDETLDRAADHLINIIPGLNIVAKIAPPFGFDPAGKEAGDVLDDLGRSGARLTFLALGSPKQEVFAARGRTDLPQMGFVSVGAGLDFLAGTQKRAPKWVRAMALEWLWRMVGSPFRLGPRYLKCALVLPGHSLRALRGRF